MRMLPLSIVSRARRRVLVALLLAFSCLAGANLAAQQPRPSKLYLGGVLPGGAQMAATDAWGLYDFSVINPTDSDRQARVTMMFEGQPDVQYGRDLWVPAQATRNSWMLVGPAHSKRDNSCDIEMQLYDRTGGQNQIVLARTDERVRSRGVGFRKREPFTAMISDEDNYDVEFGQLPGPESKPAEGVHLARTFRLVRKLSDLVGSVSWNALPALPEAYDGLAHVVVASNRLARDPAAARALRHWLERGGKVWIMLDLIDLETAAPLLGDSLDFQVVDRVSLTSFAVASREVGLGAPAAPKQTHERPVDLVRVLLPPGEKSEHNIDGWPLWFTRQVGRGTVAITTLGARGWFRERGKGEKSPFDSFPHYSYVPQLHLESLGNVLHPSPEKKADKKVDVSQEVKDLATKVRRFMPDAGDRVIETTTSFRPVVAEEIGFAVISRTTAAWWGGGGLLLALALGLVLRRASWSAVAGFMGPAAALTVAIVFVVSGESSRRAVPPTMVTAQIVEAVADRGEASVHGLLAAYRPDSGTAHVGAERGGLFDLDMEGVQGRTRRFMVTDLDAWHWDNLDLQAGVRMAPFRFTLTMPAPLSAVARFGPEGIEGEVQAGSFQNLGDALISAPPGRPLPVRLGADGTFRAGSSDLLPPGKYLTEAVLSDRQLRRQEVYRTYLQTPAAGVADDSGMLLAWADPAETNFKVVSEKRTGGDALLVIPLRFQPAAPGERVTVPGALIPMRRLLDAASTKVYYQGTLDAQQHLRLQLPAAVLPLKVERARITAKVKALSWRVTLSGFDQRKPVEIHREESPPDAIRADLDIKRQPSDERLLQLDAEGGLHVQIAFAKSAKGFVLAAQSSPDAEQWIIEYLEVEVSGVVGKR